MDIISEAKYVVATDVAEALALLENMGDKAIPLAGATWVMRAPVRCENNDLTFVDLSQIPGIQDIEINADSVSIGALVTQQNLANALADLTDLAALTSASGHSANPAVRRVATIGGNISSVSFAASDIVPALLALDAEIETTSRLGVKVSPMAAFLSERHKQDPRFVVTRILVPRHKQSSAHVRATLRKAGDYPVANVSVAISLDTAGTIHTASVAVGSVDPVAKRWTSFETALIGKKPDLHMIREIAETHTNEFTGRDAPGAPGWYRVRLLPALTAKAFKNLTLGSAK